MIGLTRISLAVVSFLCICLYPLVSRGADDVVVRVGALPEAPVVGQKVVLKLDVLARDGWAQVKSFGKIEMAGGFLRRYESQGTRLNERIDGAEYSGQRYEIYFFGFSDGDLRLDPQPLDVEVKRWGAETGSSMQRVMTPLVVVQVQRPGELPEGMSVVSSEQFKVGQTWAPESTSLKVGDALIRTITREAVDVSAMVFAPLASESNTFEGVGVYEKEPVVADSYNRGELTGKRVETITYMMERSGGYTLPELEFFWWDLKNTKLEKVKLPGLEIQVLGAAQPADALSGQKKRSQLVWVGCAAVFLAFLSAVFWKRDIIRSFIRRWRSRRQHSEKAYFARIRKAVKAEDRRAVLQTTMQWLDSLPGIGGPARLDLFFLKYGERSKQFQPILPDDTSWSPASFLDDLMAARKTYMRRKREKKNAESILPPVGLM